MKKSLFLSIFAASMLCGASISFDEAKSNFDRINPEFDDDVVLSYHSSISAAKKSVVNIATKTTLKASQNPMSEMFNDPFFKEFFGFNFNIPKQDRQSSSLGSGVIISKDGYIVTNNHVVENADEVIVTLLDNDKEYEAKIIGTDPKTDLAIIKIEERGLSAIKFSDSNKAMEGDIVFAIGNPFGVGGTITQGIVSALNKNNIGLNQYENFIQTDASINPGNSGGALVDSRGALIGINSAILSRSGGNNGIGFAIPSNMVKDIATKLITDGKIERGYIGVSISDLTKEQKEIYKNKDGALIASVEEGSAADKAGIKRGDLVIKADGKMIKNATELKNLIGSLLPNKTIELEFERGGDTKKVDIKLGSMNNSKISGESASNPIDGLTLQDLNDETRRKYSLSKDDTGVLVTNVKADSKADKFGFQVGDIIIQIGQKDIKNINDFDKIIRDYKNQKVLVWVLRGGIPQGLVIK